MERIILFIGIALLICFANILKQDLFSPAVINLYWNSLFLIGGVVVFGGHLEWDYRGILWLYVSMLMCFLGQLVGNRINVEICQCKKKDISNLWPLGVVFMVCLSIMGSYFYIEAYGYRLKDLFDLNKLLEINSTIAYDRYYGHDVGVPQITIVLNTVSYAGCLIGGYIFNYTKGWFQKISTFLVFVPILLQTFINNAKAGFIASVFLWGTGWLVSYLRVQRRSMKVSFRLGIVLGILAIAGVIFLDLIMLLRIGRIDFETQQEVNEKMLNYAFGQIHAFSVWFSQNCDYGYGFGANTFMAIADWLGVSDRIQGIYELIEGTKSNVFTSNRGLIADFGVLGAQLFWFIFGIIGSVVYRIVKFKGEEGYFSSVFLASMLFFILYGFIISPWVYTSYIFAFAIFGVALLVLKYFKISIRR